MTTPPGPDLDPTWACEARRVRRAAELLGWPELSRCLPDEPAACGYGFAQHAASYYMILCVIADHQLHQHICMPHDQQEKLYTGLHADMAANCEHSAPADRACCLAAGDLTFDVYMAAAHPNSLVRINNAYSEDDLEAAFSAGRASARPRKDG